MEDINLEASRQRTTGEKLLTGFDTPTEKLGEYSRTALGISMPELFDSDTVRVLYAQNPAEEANGTKYALAVYEICENYEEQLPVEGVEFKIKSFHEQKQALETIEIKPGELKPGNLRCIAIS